MESEKYLQIIDILGDVIIEDKRELKKLKQKIEHLEQYIEFYTDDHITEEDYRKKVGDAKAI